MSIAHIARAASALAFAGVVAGASAQYAYDYLGEPQPLAVDVTRIAVKAPAQGAGMLTQQLAAAGLVKAAGEPISIEGWSAWKVPAGARSERDVERLVASLADGGFVSPVFIDSRDQPMIMTPDLLIGFEAGVTPEQARTIIANEVGGVVLDENFAGLDGVYRVRTELRHGIDVLDAANALSARPGVKYAESDAIIRGETFIIPNDPQFGDLWGLNQTNDEDMDAPEAWDITTGDGSVEVVILDVGMQYTHPDLNAIAGQDFTGGGVAGGGPANECDDHGTAVGGCVSAIINNGIGVVGVAPDCIVKSGKIGTSTAFFGLCLGTFDSQPSMVANALNWSVTSGARVTNSSFGYGPSATVTNAYANARTNGVVHFAATGNDGSSTVAYPANLASTVAVGAMAASGNRASFSQYGVGIDISAPGQGIDSTDRTGADGYQAGDYVDALDGTSFASPYAAGVAALVISMDPSLTVAEVEQVLYDTARDKGVAGYDTTFGWGFVNAADAVASVFVPTCPGDATGDGAVDFDDLNTVLSNWGTAGPDGDLDDSGTVDFDDLNAVLSNWGIAC